MSENPKSYTLVGGRNNGKVVNVLYGCTFVAIPLQVDSVKVGPSSAIEPNQSKIKIERYTRRLICPEGWPRLEVMALEGLSDSDVLEILQSSGRERNTVVPASRW